MVAYEGKTKGEYEKVSLPEEMIDEIKKIIETDKGLGIVSIQEFVREAVRSNIIKYRGIIRNNFQLEGQNNGIKR